MLQGAKSLSSTLEHTLESQNSAHFPLQCDGQRFLLGTGDIRQDHEATLALTSIAEGQAQCAITGAAFEHLLQQQDLAVLQAVLQNAVVFARMRPHQKAQVLSLLGTAGLHQVLQGSHRHIPVRYHRPAQIKVYCIQLLSLWHVHLPEACSTSTCTGMHGKYVTECDWLQAREASHHCRLETSSACCCQVNYTAPCICTA